MQSHDNPQLQLAYNFIHYTNQNLFLTGKAGTGKTTFLKSLKKNSPKRMIVVAPTGVAAINARGVTIHSFFQLPFGPQIPEDILKNLSPANQHGNGMSNRINRFSKNKINLIRSLDLLVIDEISMVRADMLDAIDAVLRRFRDRYRPFGGLQLLMIGDLQQLAPVVKEDEWNILGKYYETCFFFSSHALKKSNFRSIELKHIYRQSEKEFIKLLNKVRDNQLNTGDIKLLNNRFVPNFISDDEGYITLTTHNYQAKRINEAKLKKLTSKLERFQCTVEGDFPEHSYPADEILEIKTGAQVMFLKNDTSPEKRYYNGKIGKVVNIIDDIIEVKCPGDIDSIIVEPDVWENTKYRLNEETSEIEEEIAGKFIQYPLKLAWAITIHKSQGLTFEKAIIDARQSFAHGQVYVALSRCKSLNGLVLSAPLTMQSVINDNTVIGFTNEVEQNQPGKKELEKHRKEYEMQLLCELFDFKPFIRLISIFMIIWNEYSGSLMGSLHSELQNMIKPVREEMINVAEKFYPQLEKLSAQDGFAEENGPLQTRLKQAATYFLSKLKNQIESRLESADFETDNKAVRKRITEGLGKLEMELEIKKACLESISTGFTIKKYLKAKSLASIEKPASKARSKAMTVNVKNPEFYKILLKWRNNKSIETGLEESRIIRQKVMMEISANLPSSAIELKAIKGMGGKKMEYIGEELLSLILNFRSENGMDIPLNAKQEVELAGLDTKETSLALFKQGLDLRAIAKKRNLAVSTIEGHLAHFVKRGRLNIYELIDRKKYNTIKQVLHDQKDFESLTDIKNTLGEGYSYSEIRLVKADLHI